MTILVTGGCGFIGSNFIHHLKKRTSEKIICIDKMTYAADYGNISGLDIDLYPLDINHSDYVFEQNKIKTIYHFAAESHVDNSIKDCSEFVSTNINGTIKLLTLAMKYEVEKFIHISTDEVYGSIEEGKFTETTTYNPRNPYSASKAASDHFVMSFYNTYGLPAIITNCSNNYGPRQHEEKLIPKTIKNLMMGNKVPIYGDGQQIRDWLYVQDHCEAISVVAEKGKFGEKYNIGGECEVKNLELIRKILDVMEKDEDMIEYVQDRPGHDRRYSTDITKIKTELGWSPRFNLEQGLKSTIKWYECNRN